MRLAAASVIMLLAMTLLFAVPSAGSGGDADDMPLGAGENITITGKVTRNGQGMEGVEIVYDVDGSPGLQVLTDTKGEYKIFVAATADVEIKDVILPTAGYVFNGPLPVIVPIPTPPETMTTKTFNFAMDLEEDECVTVSGRVVSEFSVTGKIGVPDVRIAIGFEAGLTDADGYYKILVAPGKHAVSFVKSGYDVLGWPRNINLDNTLDVPNATSPNDKLVLEDAVVAKAFGTITGTATYNNKAVPGVIIYLIDPEGNVVATGRTNEAGVYSIECSTGTYTVSISSPYYESEPYVNVVLGTIDVRVLDFELTVKSGSTYLFGFDMTHSLMIIAGIGALFVLIFAISYRIHIGKHPEASKVHYDQKKKDH